MEREQTHSKTKESLDEIINSTSVSEDAKKEAVDKLTELADIMEKESATEQLLASKGFEDAVVSIGEDSVDVVLNYEELSSSDRAQIEDIVTRKTGYSVSQLVISKNADDRKLKDFCCKNIDVCYNYRINRYKIVYIFM